MLRRRPQSSWVRVQVLYLHYALLIHLRLRPRLRFRFRLRLSGIADRMSLISFIASRRTGLEFAQGATNLDVDRAMQYRQMLGRTGIMRG